MSHFYGTVRGSRGEASRTGGKGSGMNTVAASWSGAVETRLYVCAKTGRDMFEVRQIPWSGQGVSEVIARGVIGEEYATDRARISYAAE